MTSALPVVLMLACTIWAKPRNSTLLVSAIGFLERRLGYAYGIGHQCEREVLRRQKRKGGAIYDV